MTSPLAPPTLGSIVRFRWGPGAGPRTHLALILSSGWNTLSITMKYFCNREVKG